MMKTIKLGPGLTFLVVGGLIFGGWCWGVHDYKKYFIEKAEKKDVMDQFVDIIADALGEDGEVYL